MNQKISRNEKHKYSNEENLALCETKKNTGALINIAQESDNIFKLLQNLRINNL